MEMTLVGYIYPAGRASGPPGSAGVTLAGGDRPVCSESAAGGAARRCYGLAYTGPIYPGFGRPRRSFSPWIILVIWSEVSPPRDSPPRLRLYLSSM